MAIKGKKKTQSRGSQARRRPAAPPRAASIREHRVPWYRTTAAAVMAILLVVAAAGAVAAVITNNRSEADKLEQRQEVLKAYTGQVRALLAKVDEVVSSMSAAGLGDEAARADLATEAPKWQKDLEAAGVEASAIQPIEGLDVSTRVLFQSLQLYSTAAKTFALVPDVEGKARDDLLQRAAEVSSQAGTLWGTAVSILDSELAEAELDPSGIPVPGTSAPPPPVNPTPSPSPQATIETKGNVDRGKDKKDKRRGNDDGGD